MLTYIGNKNSLVKLAVDLADDIQRSHNTTVFHGKRMFFFPFLDLFQPFFSVALLYIFIHFCDGLFCIGNDGDIYMNISGNGSSININVDNLCMWGKFMELACDTVVKTGSDGKQKIAFIYCHICGISAVHTKISDKQRVLCGNGATSHNGCDNRDLSFLNNLGKNLLRAGNDHTAASKKQRFFGLLQHFEGTLQLSDMHAGVGLVAADIDSLRILSTSQLGHYILWKVDENRAWTSGACDIESFLDDTSKILTVADGNTVFCDASGDPDNINLLERIVSDEVTGNLSGKAYKRNTVIVGSCKTCNKVGSSGTAGNETYANLSGSSGIGICFVYKGLLVTWQDDVNAALFI